MINHTAIMYGLAHDADTAAALLVADMRDESPYIMARMMYNGDDYIAYGSTVQAVIRRVLEEPEGIDSVAPQDVQGLTLSVLTPYGEYYEMLHCDRASSSDLCIKAMQDILMQVPDDDASLPGMMMRRNINCAARASMMMVLRRHRKVA